LESLQLSPRTLAVFKGPTFTGREGKGKGERERAKEKMGRDRRRDEEETGKEGGGWKRRKALRDGGA